MNVKLNSTPEEFAEDQNKSCVALKYQLIDLFVNMQTRLVANPLTKLVCHEIRLINISSKRK